MIHGCYQFTTTNGNYGRLRAYDTANPFAGCNQLEKPAQLESGRPDRRDAVAGDGAEATATAQLREHVRS